MNPKRVAEKILVRICDHKHPHWPETGFLTGKVIRMTFGDHREMAEVKLDSCKHGVDACFVSKGQVSELRETKGKK